MRSGDVCNKNEAEKEERKKREEESEVVVVGRMEEGRLRR
jgi:hypothetical protein